MSDESDDDQDSDAISNKSYDQQLSSSKSSIDVNIYKCQQNLC